MPETASTPEPEATPETASTPEPVATSETASTLEPVATPEPASTRDRSPAPTAVATSNAEPGMPATEATQAETLRTAPGPRRDAAAFRRLDSAHYTLEIARARSASELGALVVALDGVGGALYLISLRTPDGVSHSLVWSDFPSIEAARAARGTLPPDVAVTSGWPRRIGPLQAELIDP